jgi:cyclophilin family peptidyl-prolyl cis-trans isomerase/HEAT repeat protein
MKTVIGLAVSVLILQARPVPPVATLAQQLKEFGEPLVVLNAEKAWLGADAFWPLAKAGDPTIRLYAIRALGRLEDPRNVPALLTMGRNRDPASIFLMATIGDAITQSLHGFDPTRDPDLMADVTAWFLDIAYSPEPSAPPPVPRPLGQVVFGTEEQFHAAERKLMKILERFESFAPPSKESEWYKKAALALSSMLLRNPRFGPADEATVLRLRTMVRGLHRNDVSDVAQAAFRAVLSRGLDEETELYALEHGGGEMVKLAIRALSGNGGGIADEERRMALIVEQMTSGNRPEGLRAYLRIGAPLGCQPVVDFLPSTDALEAFGHLCKDDEEITRRIEETARVPAAIGSWWTETHAFIALAKRAPERVEPLMNAFTTHASPWVRLYSVQAAVAVKDMVQLEKLALDADDNVREAALEPLMILKRVKNDPVLLKDLERNDPQLLRKTAILAAGAPADKDLGSALIGALLRLTSEGKESSREARQALLEALGVHGRPQDVQRLKPLLRDFDPLVAELAAKLLTKLEDREYRADPVPVRRGWEQAFADMSNQCVKVQLSSGAAFRMQMLPSGAPIAADRFLKLALVDHYYDGLAIHRVIPDSILLAGSPGANEYSGHKEFMRDEIMLPNTAMSVGLVTHGRNSGNAQFYINLANNPQFDGDYTVFARAMNVVALEGDVIRKITSIDCKDK